MGQGPGLRLFRGAGAELTMCLRIYMASEGNGGDGSLEKEYVMRGL